jgi:hypothetical protein
VFVSGARALEHARMSGLFMLLNEQRFFAQQARRNKKNGKAEKKQHQKDR